MPKYVFELSITLAAGDDLTVAECNSISSQLAEHLGVVAASFGKRRGRISSEPPFEHVMGDCTPPDAEGRMRPTGSRPIDFDV